MHVSVHKFNWIGKTFHKEHHRYVAQKSFSPKWHWSNIFLFNDNLSSTIDYWITEVIPTIIFSWLTGNWWIFGIYYVWASTLQEFLEHNVKYNLYPLTTGKWHMVHHLETPSKNYGVFIRLWDKIFNTEHGTSRSTI